MSIRRTGGLSLLAAMLLIAVLPARAAAPSKEPSFKVTFSGATVTATGITPKASVLFFSIGTVYAPWEEGLAEIQTVVADEDGDGVVTYAMPSVKKIPPRSIWAVCDLDSGDLVVIGPGKYVPQPFPLPGNGLHRGANGQIDKLETDGAQRLELAIVRPQKGAWVGQVYDGGLGDDDNVNNGHMLRSLAGFKALAGGDAPDHLTGRDVLIVIDPGTFRYYANRIEP